MKKVLKLSFIPADTNLALLFLRVWLGIGLFAKHGIEKFTNFTQWKEHFPDLIHVGSTASLSFALIADGICSLLLIFGFATRLAALFILINLFVVFLLMHHFYFGDDHAELVFLYLGGITTIIIAGGGKYSMDEKMK